MIKCKFLHTYHPFLAKKIQQQKKTFNFSYVQHRIEEQSEHLVQQILEKNGYFFVAGSSKNMPTAVREALVTALNTNAEYVEDMIRTGRYQEETWA